MSLKYNQVLGYEKQERNGSLLRKIRIIKA